MKLVLAITIAVACGLGIGTGSAVLRFRHNPWRGGLGTPAVPSGGFVTVDSNEFDFGRMETTENGSHDFIFTNRGDQKLVLNTGTSSCSCTVGEIKQSELQPGESTTVRVTWRSKHRAGPFHQSVTILTSDPDRQEVTLGIRGEYFRSVYADPEELTFDQLTGSEPVTREARIFSNLPDQQLKIEGHSLSDTSQDRFFAINSTPLSAGDLPKDNIVKSGVLLSVTVKPGLPLGRFQQTIHLTTNSTEPLDLHVFGSVGEVTLVGPGWSSETGVLEIGTLDGRSTTLRKLIVLVRGANARQMKFKVTRVDPDFLNVKVGDAKVDDTGMLSQTEVLIEIPDSKALGTKAPVDYLGDHHGKLGEILLETISPQPHSLPIRVRFAVSGGI